MVRSYKSPETPFVQQLDINDFQKICVKGRAPGGSSRFSVYLQAGDDHDTADIAFVFDARFNYSNDQNTIVTNCKKDEAWGSEESRDVAFPFNEEEEFDLKVAVEEDSIKVKVNGAHVLAFEHRVDSKTINCVRIDGCIELVEIRLK